MSGTYQIYVQNHPLPSAENRQRDSDSGEQLNEVAVSVGTVLPGALLLGEKFSSEPPSTNRQCGDLRQTRIVVW